MSQTIRWVDICIPCFMLSLTRLLPVLSLGMVACTARIRQPTHSVLHQHSTLTHFFLVALPISASFTHPSTRWPWRPVSIKSIHHFHDFCILFLTVSDALLGTSATFCNTFSVLSLLAFATCPGVDAELCPTFHTFLTARAPGAPTGPFPVLHSGVPVYLH